MAKRFICSSGQSKHIKFRQASFDLLTDFLVNLNKSNKDKLDISSKFSGIFKDKRVIECIFLITRQLRLHPLIGYHAVELLERFMIKRLKELFTTHMLDGAAAAAQQRNYEDVVFEELKDKFPLIVFSCVQLASKLDLHSNMIDTNTAVRFLQTVGHSVSKQIVLDSELMVLKGLEFNLNTPNPLIYVGVLLEVLGHNEPSTPLEQLHHLSSQVLQFVSLQRTAIYDSLLRATTQCVNPSREQSEKFVTVTEDYMLLGVGVIAVASYILNVSKWKQVMEELSHITGISQRSISDFAHITLLHITRIDSSET
ncbi:cyclin N-terminal domain-containing protein 1 [Thalassophryne amazonica]|uniref:cyclin N-terminal domain-containing protein 1 n=1 Tax=Thalassophryne amazonica TaxID=390379 RepID=UPI0014716354|nr:cyclin N-terminal domain-containing protein 1 [Thalassophryne amazonica]